MLAIPSRPRLITPADHAQALHHTGLGRVTIARRLEGGAWRERSVPVQDLAYVVRQLAGEPDVYLTQNRFFGPRRLVARIAELDALFVDLDFHKTEHAGEHPKHVLYLALGKLEDAKIPCPSFAVSTGRGLALIWLHQPVPRMALPRWCACQRALYQTLKTFGADRLAMDAARVLRLIGTRNSRSDTLVEAILPVGEIWSFDDLADEILPEPRAKLQERIERSRRPTPGQGSTQRPLLWFTAATLWQLRLTELQRLREHRWFGPLPDGHRDLWMLLASVAMSYLVPASLVHREIVALAYEVTGGRWHEQETKARMSAVIARAEQAARGQKVEYRGRLVDPRYHFRTLTPVTTSVSRPSSTFWTSLRPRCAPATSGIWSRRTSGKRWNDNAGIIDERLQAVLLASNIWSTH